jgi:hypothetical protein
VCLAVFWVFDYLSEVSTKNLLALYVYVLKHNCKNSLYQKIEKFQVWLVTSVYNIFWIVLFTYRYTNTSNHTELYYFSFSELLSIDLDQCVEVIILIPHTW